MLWKLYTTISWCGNLTGTFNVTQTLDFKRFDEDFSMLLGKTWCYVGLIKLP